MTMPRKGAILAVGLAALASMVASAPSGNGAGIAAAGPAAPTWSEVKWPFLLDQWGTGRAFHCPAADCGAALKIYVRPKIGFCNCTAGVADDAELDRVGDVDLISPRFVPIGAGRPIAIGRMNGRSRTYSVEVGRAALSLAFNDKCDVVVATVVGERELPPNTERLAVDFLNSQQVLRWVEAALGL